MIDRDAASLLAQVVTALLILVALEDRLSPRNISRRKVRRRMGSLVEGCVAVNLVSIGMCLFIAVTEAENVFLTAVITLATLWLLLTVFLLFAAMFGREDATPTTPSAQDL
jgi:hypothetical protein